MSDLDSGSSSTEEGLLKEQARKLFKQCDSDNKGFIVKNDLESISDLLPARDLARLESAVDESDEKFIGEREFVAMINEIVSKTPQVETSILSEEVPITEEPKLVPGSSLADELTASQPVQKYHDELTEMLKQQLSSPYPFSVENASPATAVDLPTIFESHEPPVTIHKPHFRPIEPDFGKTIVAQSLADELSEAEHSRGHSGHGSNFSPEADMRTPDRIFKVVFVGDSAVGKTCFLHRFCHNRFKPLFNATIGVDFTVKTIPLRDRMVALQLWDTAGQERFRSITKQYFRKADGVVLMFDVTSEQSFLNVRNWIDSVRAGVDDSTVMCLVGNKVDLFGNDNSRNGVYREGRRLAQEFNMPFFETSAYTGYGIEHCMRAMAESLQKREEDHLEEALRLEANPSAKARSWCCL